MPVVLSTRPLLLALRLIPAAVHTELLAQLASHLLRGQSAAERLPALDGKRISIVVADAPCELRFRITGRELRAERGRGTDAPADVRIRGRLADFWLLATRAEDPDTLFFNRRLCLEGDTEIGLSIKNLLDSLEFDWQAHLNAVLGRRAAGRLIPLIARSGLVDRLAQTTAYLRTHVRD